MHFKLLFFILLFTVIESCKHDTNTQVQEEQQIPQSEVSELSFALIKTYPHDMHSFTEGLTFFNGKLYESTGATSELPQTRSLFGELDLSTGQIKAKAELDKNIYFGEGITFLNNKVYQLTWTSKVGFVYDAKSFKKIKEFTIPSTEGWGMTNDGKMLIMSDGTNKLRYLDPETLTVTNTVNVFEDGYALRNLNELEYVDGFIFANIWMTNTIVKIDPKSGKVIAKLDLSALAKEAQLKNPGSKEMNGIAYNMPTGKFFVTGKMWPSIFEIEIK